VTRIAFIAFILLTAWRTNKARGVPLERRAAWLAARVSPAKKTERGATGDPEIY
jgi:hypothetical protein